MPAKWKPSIRMTRIRNAEGKLVTIPRARASFQHFYIHQTPKQELIDYLNNKNGKPKLKVKALNELTRRGVRIVWK